MNDIAEFPCAASEERKPIRAKLAQISRKQPALGAFQRTHVLEHNRLAKFSAGDLKLALSGLDVDVWPSGANFVLFRPLSKPGREVWQGLVDRSVLVRDTSSWPGLEGCLRVTVGTPAEDDAFLTALTEVLS